MSRVSLTTLQGIPSQGNVISLGSGIGLYARGAVIQTNLIRTATRSTYAAAITGNGSTITDLNLSITPRFANSLILLTWMINGEVQYDTVFLIHQNGVLITTAGYEAYNREAGNSRWSGVSHGQYENDVDSTMTNWHIQYAIPAGTTTARTYAPSIRSSNATAQTFFLNRPANAVIGADNYENAVSTGVVMEIAQ
jgi:hypothetical protein